MPRQIPRRLTAKYNFSFSLQLICVREITDYTITLSLRGPNSHDFTGVISGNDIQFTGVVEIPGNYKYTLLATDTNNSRTLIESGMLLVERDPTTISVDEDLRTYADKALAAVEAVLLNKATKDQQSYSIAGRSITKMPLNELLDWRDRLKREVAAQNRKLPRAVLTRFRS